jgi:hypothetical protein
MSYFGHLNSCFLFREVKTCYWIYVSFASEEWLDGIETNINDELEWSPGPGEVAVGWVASQEKEKYKGDLGNGVICRAQLD